MSAGGSGVTPAPELDPTTELANSLTEYARWQSESLLTVFHHSFRTRKIAGYAGEKREFQPTTTTRTSDYFTCPCCGHDNTPGSLLCLLPQCLAVYYFDYDDQIFSPIAQRVYEIQAAAIVEDFNTQEKPDWGDDAASDLEEVTP